jgi:hypothetical protein
MGFVKLQNGEVIHASQLPVLNENIKYTTIYQTVKATELRIGNYINDMTGGLATVRGITDKGIWITGDGGPAPESAFSPILLTEEILVSSGFKLAKILGLTSKIYRKEYHGTIYQFVINEKYGIENPNCGTFGIYNPTEIIPSPTDENPNHSELFLESYQNFSWNIKHLHRLQNMWFDLTGEELTIHEAERS